MRKLMVLVAAQLVAVGVCAALPAPMAWFDIGNASGTTVPDASGNGHDLTLGSTVTVVDDEFVGKALKVTGQKTDWAAFTCPVVTDTTVAFWMCRDAQDGAGVGTYPYVMSTGYSGYGINYTRNTSGIVMIDQWDANASGGQLTFDSVDVGREAWHHVVMTMSRSLSEGGGATFECKVYVDGALKRTRALAAATVRDRTGGSANVLLLNNGKGSDRATSGKFADFRFYDTCLDAAEVAELSGGLLSDRRLVVRYAFDELSATADANGRYATPAATPGTDAIRLGKNMSLVDDGVDGKALRFMATTEIGGTITLPAVALKERTVSVWLRQSSARRDMNALVANPYPRLFHGLGGDGGYVQLSNLSTLGRDVTFIPSGCGTANKATTSHGVADLDVWSHLAIVERLTSGGKAVADIYVNGSRVVAGTQEYDLKEIPMSTTFYLGCNAVWNSNRYYCGDMDEFRIYNYALSADEVRRLARGLAKVSAGADFTAAGGRGVLQGSVAANAGDGLRKGYAGTVAWTLVSAPAGGEGAKILQPAAAETEVVLPVEGAYVFRLTVSDLGVSRSDEVTVTCVAEAQGNAAPAVSAAAAASAVTQPDPAVLTATVSDDGLPAPARTRVRWAKKSGPGGVWFDAYDAPETSVRFGAAGTYVLTCTADDGQATASADVTVAVADRTDGKDLATDLLHYWSLDGQANPYFVDPVGRRTDFTAPNYTTLRHVPGKVGYGARASAYSGAGSYWSTGASIGETAQATDATGAAYGGTNPPPVNDYLTISAWIYIDPEDANLKAGNVVGASVVGQGYAFGLRYNEKVSPTAPVNENGFSLYQQGRTGSNAASTGINGVFVHYPAPNPSPVGRWMHICGILARNQPNSALWEMWYDGVKQTATASTGNTRGRVNGNKLLIGGMDTARTTAAVGDYNANWAKPGTTAESSAPADFYSRTFPGVVDEVRIWTRKLTPEEIRYLAANPVIGENGGPSVDTPTAVRNRVAAGRTAQVASAAFADQLPAGGSLTYTWSVVSDNASLASFRDATSASTTFTASKVGTYVLQLAVSDGERTVCSKPLSVEVTAAGMVILLK